MSHIHGTMLNFAKENKSLLYMITFFLLVLELEIFIHATMKSGDLSQIQVLNSQNEVIYESSADKLYQFNKYYFEQNFGPLENYRVRREKIERPFPFRAWVISAIGLPIGFIMILGFIVKAWAAFFKGEAPVFESTKPNNAPKNRSQLERLIEKISGLNVFVLGFFIVSILFLYWVLPDMIVFISRASIDTIIKFKWFFIVASFIIAALFGWFIYLKYLLAKKAIDSQTEIEKFKLQFIHNTGHEITDDQKQKMLSSDDTQKDD